MTRAAVTPESLIGHFRHMRAAHHDLYSHGAHCIRHAIGLGDHPGHRADADQSHILFTHISRNTFLIHGLRVTINQHHFVARRSQCLQQEHPKMRHEVARHAVVRVVQ